MSLAQITLAWAGRRRVKQYKGKWIRAKKTQNLPRIHQKYKTMIPSVKYRDIWIGFTDLAFCKWQMPQNKNQKETPYTEEGRTMNFIKTKRKRANARLDEICAPKTVDTVLKGKWGKLNNFEFIMNRAYALNRDKLKCKVCGGWLIDCVPWAHRINPNLPLNQVNRVNNLASVHKQCFIAINHPKADLSQFDEKARKKIDYYRKKIGHSYKQQQTI